MKFSKRMFFQALVVLAVSTMFIIGALALGYEGPVTPGEVLYVLGTLFLGLIIGAIIEHIYPTVDKVPLQIPAKNTKEA